MNIFDHYRQRYEAAKDEEFTLQEFLTICRQDRSAYANAAERLLMAIGEPVMVDTAQEPRLSRLFSNRVIARYPAFEEFYGMEDAIEQIVSYLKHAAQGLEEKKQILYLLGIGKFYTEDARNNNQNSNVMSSVLSSTLSGQLNNALSQVFETNNWNIGTNLSTGDKGWTDMEVEGILSGQLLNNRLLINGNFGYRDNPMANTNFVGDFEAEWLITRSGDIRLKAYNETNDRYYTKTNLTTQGVGIMYKKDFNKWSDLYFWNKWRLRNKRKREEAEMVKPQQTDSITDKTAKSAVKRNHSQQQ